jgi:vacuolar-type H+-ATPase subunit E/Vma4
MKIDAYQVAQKSVSSFQRIEKQEVNINIQTVNLEDQLDISQEGLQLQDVEEPLDEILSDEDKRKLELLESFISWLTGKKFKFSSVVTEKGEKKGHQEKHKARASNPGFAMRIYTSSEVYEKESMSFSSSGKIKTEDGREIDFDLNLNMSRETYQKNEALLQVGEFHDPLVMNFDGQGVGLSDQKFQIDLDLDGKLDDLNFLSQGSGFLVLDKNNNGEIDDGRELFGPQSQNGFSELAAYDDDGNGWIDENDDIFESLKIWSLNDQGEKTLVGIKEKGVGAIYLGAVASQYTLKHGDEDMARVAQSSIYLKENGQAQTIHQMDYKL